MSSIVGLEAPDLDRFSLPHALRLVGEQQHLLGFGCISLATNLRIRVQAEETGGDFSLSFGGGAPLGEPVPPVPSGVEGSGVEGSPVEGPVLSAAEGPVLSAAEGPVLSPAEGPVLSPAEGPVLSGAEGPVLSGAEGRLPRSDEAPVSEFAARWQKAIGSVIVADPSALTGLNIEVDFGRLWAICPPQVLLGSPAVAVGLAIAVTAHRKETAPATEPELAELAHRLQRAAAPDATASAGGSYGEALMSIIGGAGYVEPGGDRLNVQQLLPPESLILALAPGVTQADAEVERGAAVREALRRAEEAGCDLTEADEQSLSRLFELGPGALDEQQITMIYGLLRVRQMIESFLEHLGQPFVDNDRLAEICDEESVILADYFGFPAAAYDGIRATAGEAGALGAKLTWAFGGYPATIILAPGRREEVQEALCGRFPEAHFVPINMDPIGLLRWGEDLEGLGAEFWED